MLILLLASLRRGWVRHPTFAFPFALLLDLLAPALRAGTPLSSQDGCASRLFLGHVKHTNPQQREFGATIHAPFNELKPVHMPFEGTLAPRQRQSCKHRRLVLLDASGKRLQLGQVALFHRTEPGIQRLSCMLSDHLHEPLCQAVSGLCAWTGLPDSHQFFTAHLV